VHDFLTVGAAAPLQAGAAFAIDHLPRSYYTDLARSYREKRDTLLAALQETLLRPVSRPQGAYYILTDAMELQAFFGQSGDAALARHLIREYGLATVPGSSFFVDPRKSPSLLRFCYCKQPDTLARAVQLFQEFPRQGSL